MYTILNAIRLVLADRRPLSDAELHALIRTGFRFLSGRLTVEQGTLSGLRVQLWRNLARALLEAVRSRTGMCILLDPLCPLGCLDRAAAFEAIESALALWRPVMLLCRGGHYRVVSGYTPASLLLFDSGGQYWLAKQACGVPGDGQSLRHMLYPASFMAIHA